MPALRLSGLCAARRYVAEHRDNQLAQVPVDHGGNIIRVRSGGATTCRSTRNGGCHAGTVFREAGACARKRQALQACEPPVATSAAFPRRPVWRNDAALLNWLSSLSGLCGGVVPTALHRRVRSASRPHNAERHIIPIISTPAPPTPR